MQHILVLDQGTTSSRAILYDEQFQVLQVSQLGFEQHYPQSGWVEHNPEDIWSTCKTVLENVIQLESSVTIAGLGITNQRETTILWERDSGRPIANAIVWQDRRTAKHCREFAVDIGETFTKKTGLLLDPYFSVTKILWLLENIPNARKLAQQGKLAFGTVDTFLIWRLTAGTSHITDVTNASRTGLFHIHDLTWDKELLKFFNIPASILPKVAKNCANFGVAYLNNDNNIPICAVAGDQQAAAFGQQCFYSGDSKSTYGTGCFLLVNTGQTSIKSKHRNLTTIGYQVTKQVHYALEGSIFNAGTTIQWLRDELQILENATASETIVAQTKNNQGVYFVPAFTGLGAPYWNSEVRAAVFGITRNTNRAQLIRACLESVAYQTYDLLQTMTEENTGALTIKNLRIDGGMANNNWLAQFLANINQITIERPQQTESTALGVAYMVALHAKIITDIQALATISSKRQVFDPKISLDERAKLISGWHEAVRKLLSKN